MRLERRATAIGFCAIVLWSSVVALIREVSNSFGTVRGTALMYSIASVFLCFTPGWVPLSKFSKKYLVVGGILMVCYEVCLALSLGYSHNSRQAIEVGMMNYLWPALTLLATIIFHTKKANWLIVPGIILSILGIVWVLAGKEGLNITAVLSNMSSNPLSYGLAFSGACIWAGYCVVTIKLAKGLNGITFFFILVAAVLWVIYFAGDEKPEMEINMYSITYLISAALAMGFGYAAWNIGIMKGNVILLTGASYFIPVFSSAFSSILLSTSLGISFWQGAFMVCIGSGVCWLSTRNIWISKNKQAAPR